MLCTTFCGVNTDAIRRPSSRQNDTSPKILPLVLLNSHMGFRGAINLELYTINI